MEYLMTYGWSILIIAIVLAALFSLGVFSNSNLGPRAQPNSCRVFRPNGPGTTTNINLEGVCNGELPVYTAVFGGTNSQVSVTDANPLDLSSGVTLSVWVNIHYMSSGFAGVVDKTTNWGGITNGYGIRMGGSYGQFEPWVGNGLTASDALLTAPALNTWNNVVLVYASGSGGGVYINGVFVGSSVLGSVGNINPEAGQPLLIGSGSTGDYFNGSIANVQIYSNAFASNDVMALYLEGIGGAPIEPQNLAAWYPLDGDPNDYSGNADNGAATNVIFTSTWTSGYTTP